MNYFQGKIEEVNHNLPRTAVVKINHNGDDDVTTFSLYSNIKDRVALAGLTSGSTMDHELTRLMNSFKSVTDVTCTSIAEDIAELYKYEESEPRVKVILQYLEEGLKGGCKHEDVFGVTPYTVHFEIYVTNEEIDSNDPTSLYTYMVQ